VFLQSFELILDCYCCWFYNLCVIGWL